MLLLSCKAPPNCLNTFWTAIIFSSMAIACPHWPNEEYEILASVHNISLSWVMVDRRPPNPPSLPAEGQRIKPMELWESSGQWERIELRICPCPYSLPIIQFTESVLLFDKLTCPYMKGYTWCSPDQDTFLAMLVMTHVSEWRPCIYKCQKLTELSLNSKKTFKRIMWDFWTTIDWNGTKCAWLLEDLSDELVDPAASPLSSPGCWYL